ncbi:MAG: hypothetical protein EKK51_00195 [Mycolicibacterium sp.]|uniref:hypothetical protein n=1 Tax=Mycolicibacterium sp. TaxID=2320850 RepID=UPI000F9A3E8D|nr:hypothetical protein [Mycolicibacterium sp.]RUP35013.1 MAG: hypothetical protein EKK51_00195 [Mycolicibacterium sp.]
MNPTHKSAPVDARNTAGAEEITNHQIGVSTMPTIQPTAEAGQCRHCTAPTAGSNVCSFCASYTPPAACTGDVWCGCTCHACTVTFEHCGTGALIVDDLLAEADQHIVDDFTAALTARMAHASEAFPLAGWSCYVTEVDGNRITVTATRRDPETRTCTTREFIATLVEVTA